MDSHPEDSHLLLDIGRLHHVGVVADDLEMAANRFESVYGISVPLLPESEYTCRIDGVEHSIVQQLGMSVIGPPHLELLRAVPGSDVWKSTSSVHHLGFVVDDVAEASWELIRRGAPLWMGGLRNEDCPAGTAYHHGPLGVTIELLDRSTRDGLETRMLDAVHRQNQGRRQ